MKSVELEVRNESGLHARPAAALVRLAGGYRSRIGLENRSAARPAADAKSLTSVLAAGVESGHRVRIWADGDDEEEAIRALTALLEAAGDESEAGSFVSGGATHLPIEAAMGGSRRLRGLPGAPGIAIGPIWRPGAEGEDPGAGAGTGASGPAMNEHLRASPNERLRAAAARAAEQLNALAGRLCEMDRTGEAEILEAQALVAVDPVLLDAAARLIGEGRDAAAAIVEAAEGSARKLEDLADELLFARASDVRDVAARIARNVAGVAAPLPVEPSIVVATDLAPSTLVEAAPGSVAGVALAGGSPTAHVAILARGLGIPAVVAVEGLAAGAGAAGASATGSGDATGAGAAARATHAAIDGDTGELILDPDAADLDRLRHLRAARAALRRHAADLRGAPVTTRDDHRIRVLANIRRADDARRALAEGAEGVGLFRTEYLFLHRQSPPTEAEQVAAYRQVMEVFGPDRPVAVRLVDIGGDKSAPYLGLAEEANPFMGVRAIRLAHRSRELLVTQLRAIWRAAGLAGVTPHVMAPMISTLADVRLLIELRDEARAAVEAAGAPCPDRIVTGVMIEVPSAAQLAPELARLVDFFSIGTNDLTQYVLAADRGNPALARLQDALHPAVLRTIAGVISGAAAAGIPVAVCGEAAGDPAGVLVLTGLGVDELSADPSSLDQIRLALAAVTMTELRELASAALAAGDAETVRELAAKLLARG